MPERIQLKRTKGWLMPPNTVKVDRSTRWGNPFIVERETSETWLGHGRAFARFWCVRAIWIRGCPHEPLVVEDHWSGLTREAAVQTAVRAFRDLAATRPEVELLRGKNLACWCPVGSPCHADVLLELANA